MKKLIALKSMRIHKNIARKGLFILIALILFLFDYLLFMRPQMNELGKLNEKNQQLKEKVQAAKSEVGSMGDFERKFENVK
ncbi:hypothetical protein ACFL1E_04995, partial [Candidatus Omnitrophota bacterium]